jgi:hypothetical protein
LRNVLARSQQVKFPMNLQTISFTCLMGNDCSDSADFNRILKKVNITTTLLTPLSTNQPNKVN